MAVFATGLTAVMFLFGMACTLHTFTLPQFSCRGKQIQLEIDFSVGPALGIIVLLITGCLPFSSLLSGLVGTGTLKPWVILIVFYGMAYLCVALDDTGLLKWLALKARNAAGNSGRRLFLYFFIFCSCLTLTTSNDVVILTMTPIIVYTANYARIDPIPYLYGQFFAANLWSMALYTGNPTNIIVAQALEYTFVGYLLWMVLPAIAAGLTCLCLLWFAFRHHIPEHISLDPVDTSGIITDRLDATVGGTLLMSCLAIVAFSNVLHAPIWVICLVFAGTALSFAFCRDARERYAAPAPILRLPTAQAEEDDVALSPQDVDAAPARRTWRRLRVVGRLPWKLLPFVVSLFVMVEALDYAGILPFCARLLGAAVSTPHPGPYAYLKAVLIPGFVSLVACQFLNNQPMTVLFTRLLMHHAYVQFPGNECRPNKLAASLSLVMASNVGGNVTLIGALAGIMWSSILLHHNLVVSYKSFARYGVSQMPIVMVVGCLVLWIEICVAYAHFDCSA